MGENATLAKRLAFSFGVIVLLAVVSTIVSVYALQRVVREKDHVIDVNAQAMVLASSLESAEFRTSAAIRGYLLTGDQQYMDRIRRSREEIAKLFQELRRIVESAEGKQFLVDIAAADVEYNQQVEYLRQMRASNANT